MSEENFSFIWQHKFNNKWKTYSADEQCLLNKAESKYQKTVTLPSTDPKKKITVDLHKMLQKNMISGFEQEVRCLIYHDRFFIFWGWEEENNWISYPARIAFSLEIAHGKNFEKMQIFNKADYEVNFRNMTQVNVRTKYTRPVCRQVVEIYDKDPKSYGQHFSNCFKCEKILQERIADDSLRSSDIIFNLPSTSGTSGRPTSPLEVSQHDNIVQALSAEVASTSGSNFSGRNLDAIPVDPACPEAENYHIYCENNDVYKVTLNFTNLQENNNKYFIIELLKSRNKNLYATWFHWGRTGYSGQNSLVNYGSNLADAKAAFEKKFYDKTHNHWENRENFVRKSSKYDLVHTDFSSDVSLSDIQGESKLHEKIQDLLKIICDKKHLEEAAKELSYDTNKTPLGKITAKQILEGYSALDNITTVLKKKSTGKAVIDACNIFYTKIPHNFGRQTPPLLTTLEDVKEKLKMLEALSNIALAMDMLNSQSGNENLLDKYYKSLGCNLIPLDHSSEEFIILKKCLLGTHGPTHSTYTMELVDAFFCTKEEHESSFINHGNNKLLWHGSRLSNWIGILKKGLQIAPPEAPSTGYMFGKGIYFADVSSKSANYCLPTKKKNEGLLLLSEVSLGNPFAVRDAVNLSEPPRGYNSVVGTGKIRPQIFETTVLSSDAVVSAGPLEEDVAEEYSLNYNEYVVYNAHQVKMKYVLRVKFNF